MNLLLLREYLFALVARSHRYHYGGSNPIRGFDCSGIVCEVMESVGVFKHGIRMNSQQLHDHFALAPRRESIGLGDLAFYGKSEKLIDHVAICLDDYFMIEAGGGDSTTTTDEIAIQRNAFVRMRPIHYRRDYLITLSPPYQWSNQTTDTH